MQLFDTGSARIHYQLEGPATGAPIVFANSLGTDLRLWDKVIPLLPEGLRILRFDKRGHGLSSVPPAPYSMGALVTDIERLMDHLNMREAMFVGLSIGGMIAQGLAVKRLDLVRSVVLSNTGAKIGTKKIWEDRIESVHKHGIETLGDNIMERWFSRGFRATPDVEIWRNMLVRQPVEGYTGCSAAIAGTDMITPTSGLRLPALTIAGSEDGSTPPDMLRELADMIPGSRFELIRRAGHLPCVEQPAEYARILTDFMQETGHI